MPSQEHVGKDPVVTITVGETTFGMPSQKQAGKDPGAIVTVGGATAGMPSQTHVVSSIVHDVHQSKEPPGMIILSHLH